MKKLACFGLVAAIAIVGCSTMNKGNYGTFTAWEESYNGRDVASGNDVERCAERIRNSCELSHNNRERIEDNVQTCKQFKSRSGGTTLQVLLLRDSGKVIAVQTEGADVRPGRNGNICPVTKYTIDRDGIDTMKVAGNKIFMLSRDGQVFFMYSDERVFELLNDRTRRSYRGVTDIKGSSDGHSITLVGNFRGADWDGKDTITDDELQYRINRGFVRKMDFRSTTTDRSLFRDE